MEVTSDLLFLIIFFPFFQSFVLPFTTIVFALPRLFAMARANDPPACPKPASSLAPLLLLSPRY